MTSELICAQAEAQVTAPARSGCFIHGLHLEGARWDTGAGTLAESRHKELYCSMPVVWLRPEQVSGSQPLDRAQHMPRCTNSR